MHGLDCEYFAEHGSFWETVQSRQATFAHIGQGTPGTGQSSSESSSFTPRHWRTGMGGTKSTWSVRCCTTSATPSAAITIPTSAAAMLKPFVSPENVWMVQHHGIFQGYYFFHNIDLDPDMRDQFRDLPGLF